MRPLSDPRLCLGDPPGDPMQALERLRKGWRPTPDNLADAAVLDEWLLVPNGYYLLQGWTGSSLKSGMALAFEAPQRWARLIDRWVVLGRPLGVPLRVSNDEVMRAAAHALAGCAASERARDVAIEARVLAARARRARLDAAASLLESAAWEADVSVALRETS